MNKNEFNHGNLTDRQIEIMTLFAQDMSIQKIANKLFISVNTVERHLDDARVNLGLDRRTSLIIYYYFFLA